MIRAIIIEDEPNGRQLLQALLTNFCQGVEVVAAAASVQEGLTAIQAQSPDVVFLDVEMPKENGFKLFDYLPNIDFEVIFTTAYSEYAPQAFRHAALDYLLKPISPDQLQEALDRVKARQEQEEPDASTGNERKLAIPTMEGMTFVPWKDLIYCAADGNYTLVYLYDKNGKVRKEVVSKVLSELEELLAQGPFLRIHRSHLVNLHHIDRFTKGSRLKLHLSNGSSVSVSQNKRELFLERIYAI